MFCGCFGSVVGNKFWNSVKFLLIELLKKKKNEKEKKNRRAEMPFHPSLYVSLKNFQFKK